MIIDAKYKPWLACAQDTSRPHLEFVKFEPCGEPDRDGLTPALAVAADGFILAVAPCKLEPDDVPGLVHRDALKWTLQLTPPKKRKHSDPRLIVALEEKCLRLRNGITIPRQIDGLVTPYPDWRALIDKALHPHERRELKLVRGFDAALLGKVCAALGENMVRTLQLDYQGPVFVEPLNAAYPDPPFGMFMPMHLDSYSEQRWTKYLTNGHQPEEA